MGTPATPHAAAFLSELNTLVEHRISQAEEARDPHRIPSGSSATRRIEENLLDLFPEAVCEVIAERIRARANHPGVNSSAAIMLLAIFADEP